ncbi:DUF1521 domain-containing protein [Kinneretia aquatilis]|uniref:DUF1521 domain-containing protein n=1 Tax=Kinneretia aquatilis TaxID=2070761 RepID=UPI00149531CC|nr:DUF1521 domain-containing protein [Paucibacter aquatile]WIV98262.1 DUF1521 domain-containing protein [Paucibacter aquatile]
MFTNSVSSASAGIAIGGCGPVDRSNPSHASTSMQGGKAVFENDNYRITAADANRVEITNKKTGENYVVWGDPHVNVDGQHAFDFWGTTTFKLDDGTKLTFETVPAGNDMTLPSKLTITNGDYGVRISGIDTNQRGDLKIDEAKGWGQTLDGVTDDGNVLLENANGKGFVAVDGNGKLVQVNQNYINGTDLQKGGAAAAAAAQQQQQLQQLAQIFQGAFQAMSSILSISLSGALLRNLLGQDSEGSRANTGVAGGGRAWTGGTVSFNEAANPQGWTLSAQLTLNLTLTRWQA